MGVVRRALEAALALSWWMLLATLLWVCFLRPGPRDLAATLAWFSTPAPGAVLLALALVLTSGGAWAHARIAHRAPSPLVPVTLLCGLALAAPLLRASWAP